MEFKAYLRLLKKHKLMLLIMPLVAMVATYYIVRFLPDSYQAKGQIVTGLVDQNQAVMNDKTKTQGQRNDEFTNLIETMQLDKVINQVSYALAIHDLTQSKPFREIAVDKAGFTNAQKQRIVELLKQKQQTFDLLNPSVPFESRVDSLIGLAGYNADLMLKKNLKIYHFEGSDFINIDAESEDPNLSAFMVNTLINKFIGYYAVNISMGHDKSNEFLSQLLNEKKSTMREKIDALQSFKIKHNILDMGNESKDVYGQISNLEGYRQQADKDVIAYTGALKSIDGRFNPKDRRYLEATSAKVNSAILNTRERLRVVNNKYLESGFDPKYKKSVDSLQNVLTEEIGESTDKYISNPLAAKDNLVQEKLKMENNLELAKFSSRSLAGQISSLKGRLNSLVPAEAIVNSLERDIDVATKEYLDVQEKYNQANLNNSIPVQLRQLHAALPGAKQPSKKIFLIALSGAAAVMLCMFIILMLFYFDNSVRNRDDLERITQIKVLGELNKVPEVLLKKINAKDEHRIAGSIQTFRNLIRDIRFEIQRTLGGNKLIAVTSMRSGQGKTLFSLSLAYAYAMSNKKVLLIDGNFAHPHISQIVQPHIYLETLLQNSNVSHSYFEDINTPNLEERGQPLLLQMDNKSSIGLTLQRLNAHAISDSDSDEADYLKQISVIGNRGGDKSLSEISTEVNIKFKLESLKRVFDIIIIETGSLDMLSRSKEWTQVADKVIGVFENDQAIKGADRASIQYMHSLNGKMLGWILNKAQVEA